MRYPTFIATFFLLIGVNISLLSAQSKQRSRPPLVSDPPDAAKFERRVLELTNLERKKAGIPPLKMNPCLSRSARWLAQEMGEKNYFAHTDKKGRSIEPRLPDFGYTNYQTIGENIAAGQPTPEAVVEGWVHSEKHRHNLLSRDHTEMGVGFALVEGSTFRTYWVQDFGNRFDNYPVVVNEGFGETTSCEVRLFLYGETWAEQVRFSHDGQTWSAWEPFSANRKWLLTEGEGTRVIYVELKHGDKVLPAQESIELVKEKPVKPSVETAKSEMKRPMKPPRKP